VYGGEIRAKALRERNEKDRGLAVLVGVGRCHEIQLREAEVIRVYASQGDGMYRQLLCHELQLGG
jgi:hypothetical protein